MATCSPQIASGPLADLGYVEEVCFGNIPVNPSLKVARRRSTSLALTKDAYSSDEVRSDRMVSDSRHGIRRAGGDIVTEISPGSHGDFMEAVLGGVWVSPEAIELNVSDITPTINASGTLILTLSGGDEWDVRGFRTGDTVTFAGTGDALFDGKIFTLVGVGNSLACSAIPYSGFPSSLSATTLDAGTLSMKGGSVAMGNIYRSFTFERAFTDIGSFISYTGCRFNMMSVDLPPSGIATATYTVLGKDALPIGSASIDGVAEIVLTDSTLTTLDFDAATGTITAAAGDFVAAGIEAGDRIIFDGTGITDGQNRNPRTVIAVTSTVLTVAEAIQDSSSPYAGPFTVTRVGLPAYTAAPDDSVLVAVSGVLVKDSTPIATVTAMTFSIDNQMAGSEVVGANTIPANLFGNQCMVNGSMTVLFDRGGAGEDLYNAFDLEQDNIAIIMRLDSADGTDCLTFTFPRCKMNSGTIGDAVAEGLPVNIDFTALKPPASAPGSGASQIVISDTSIAA